MSVSPASEYTFVKFVKSKRRDKKYTAILKNKKTGRTKSMSFGSSLHQNYKDETGLNAYPEKMHGDIKRLELYRRRHAGEGDESRKYSPGWFSWWFLWRRPEEKAPKLT